MLSADIPPHFAHFVAYPGEDIQLELRCPSTVQRTCRTMKPLEEPTRQVMEEYRRRFGHLPDLPAIELDLEKRGRFVAALERALQRNMALFDYELQEFEISRVRRLWLLLKRRVGQLVTGPKRVL